MTRLTLLLVPFVLTVAFTSPGVGQMVEAPVYKSWSRYPIGTTLVQKTVLKGKDGSTSESKTTQTLISKDESVAVVEQTYVDAAGEVSTQTFRHRSRVALPAGVKPSDLGRPKAPKDSGDETLELGGQSFETTWYDTTGQAEAGTMLIRTWFSDEVPGTIARVLTRIDGHEASTTIELVELKIP